MSLSSNFSRSRSSLDLLFSRLCPWSSPNPSILVKTSDRIFGASRTDHKDNGVTARKTNYYLSSWDYHSMQSLTNGFDVRIALLEKEHQEELEKMKEEVKALIKVNKEDPLVTLELIDAIQQLGLQYHFKEEIKHALGIIHKGEDDDLWLPGNLYATALRFRLLRQHGYKVPQDVFRRFMDETPLNFKESLHEDTEGLLSLYEASFLGWNGEMIIDKAMEFSHTCLQAMDKDTMPKRLAVRVDRALAMPIHWRTNRLQARWFMGVYEEEPDMNAILLKLAKLDFNIVQSIHMKEINKLARWWVELGINKINFSRDVVMDSFKFCSQILFEPNYAALRVMNAKIGILVFLMDDVYDAYGSLEELELLTDFIDRWDITGIDKLPYTIQTCFLAMYNTINEIGHWAMIEHGINIIPVLRKEWADHGKAWLVEAKWAHKVLNPPTMKEYLYTGTLTAGTMHMLKLGFITTADKLSAETLDSISETPMIMLSSCLILRLANDWATSLYGRNEGDNMKAVEVYMNETGEESEEVARDRIKNLIREAWKTMNEDVFDHQLLSRTVLNACLDNARASQYLYERGTGNDDLWVMLKEDVISLFIEPVPMH